MVLKLKVKLGKASERDNILPVLTKMNTKHFRQITSSSMSEQFMAGKTTKGQTTK